MPPRYLSVPFFFLLCASAIVRADDRRIVSQPALPAAICATLHPEEGGGDDGARIQRALDRCTAGQAVRLVAGRYVSGPLLLPSGVTLWLDRSALLAASTNPADFDRGSGQCGAIDDRGNACRALITINGASGSRIVGDGTIDGQGGAQMTGREESWWQLARRAQRDNGKQNVPRLIEIDRSRDITLYRVRLRNAPGFHVAVDRVQGFTAWGVVIDTPADARNTDGIDPSASEDVTITHCFIRTGDDNIAIKAGHGASRHLSIIDNHFFSGHGMSIGSETLSGVSDVLVRNLTLDGTTWGLRIKSAPDRGGLVENVRYENVCLRGNRWPLSLTTDYEHGEAGGAIPLYRDIVLRNVSGSGGTVQIHGLDDAHRLQVELDGVRFAGGTQWDVVNADIRQGADGGGDSCSRQWVDFPVHG
jgi:polygalacturonase